MDGVVERRLLEACQAYRACLTNYRTPNFPFPSNVSFRGEEGWYGILGAYDLLACPLSFETPSHGLRRRCLCLGVDNHSPLAGEVDPSPPDSLHNFLWLLHFTSGTHQGVLSLS